MVLNLIAFVTCISVPDVHKCRLLNLDCRGLRMYDHFKNRKLHRQL